MASDREPDYDAMSDEDLMERCRAARCMIDATRDEDLALVAFMELFHPDYEGRPVNKAQAQRWRGVEY